jgi:hypothetical protein
MPSSQPSGSGVLLPAALCLLAVVATVPAGASSSSLSVTNATTTPETPTAGETFEVEISIENHDGGDRAVTINEVFARGSANREYVADDLGTLPPDASTTVSLPVSFADPGWHTFDVHLYGRAADGGVVTIQHPVTVRVVEPQRPQVELEASEALPGTTRPVNVSVANGDRVDLRQVAVTVDSPTANFTVARRVRARLAAGNTTTFRFPATVAESGTYPVNVTVRYTENGERRRVSRTFPANFDGPDNPGEIALTEVDAVARGNTLEISATASNLGSSGVDGVVVSVGDAPNVGSADYFVGSVDGSDFSSFTLSAAVSGNVSAVPVEIRYVVDGVERTHTRSVSVERAPVEHGPTPNGGGGPPLVGAAAVAVVLAVLVVGYRWRGRR